jgi:hypothetical protein
MGFSYLEAYRLPVWQRQWFVERLQKEFKQAAERNNGEYTPSRAAHENDPTTRAMMGMRPNSPAKLRRFT